MRITLKDLIQLAAIGAGEMEVYFTKLGHTETAQRYHEQWQVLSHDYEAVLEHIEIEERGGNNAEAGQ